MTPPTIHTPLDSLPANVRAFFDATMNLLNLYMKGHQKIEMMVGLTAKATLTIEGGPITKETIEDVLAHLAFYKRYFPKAGEISQNLDTPEKIMAAMKAEWAEHSASLLSEQSTQGE